MKIFQRILQIGEAIIKNRLVKTILLAMSVLMIMINYLEGQEESVTFIYNNF